MDSGREIVGLPYNYKQVVYTIVQSGVIGIQVSRLRLFWFLGGSNLGFSFLGSWVGRLGPIVGFFIFGI